MPKTPSSPTSKYEKVICQHPSWNFVEMTLPKWQVKVWDMINDQWVWITVAFIKWLYEEVSMDEINNFNKPHFQNQDNSPNNLDELLTI